MAAGSFASAFTTHVSCSLWDTAVPGQVPSLIESLRAAVVCEQVLVHLHKLTISHPRSCYRYPRVPLRLSDTRMSLLRILINKCFRASPCASKVPSHPPRMMCSQVERDAPGHQLQTYERKKLFPRKTTCSLLYRAQCFFTSRPMKASRACLRLYFLVPGTGR